MLLVCLWCCVVAPCRLVVDTDNNRVVKFSSAGQVIATYSTTQPKLVEPGGIVLDSQGSIYVCDSQLRTQHTL